MKLGTLLEKNAIPGDILSYRGNTPNRYVSELLT